MTALPGTPDTSAAGAERLAELVRAEVERQLRQHRRKTTIVVFSGEMERLFSALAIANGAAAMGLEATLFFAFWGLLALRTSGVSEAKPSMDRALPAILPSSPGRDAVPDLDSAGDCAGLFHRFMKNENVRTLGEMLEDSRELGVRLVACQMSMDLLGIRRGDLIPEIEMGGVATYIRDAAESTITLFV